MAHDPDGALKQRLLSEPPPPLSKEFESQTAVMLANTVMTRPVAAQGPVGYGVFVLKPNWVLALTLGLALALAWKWGVDKSAEDEELLRVDTLSMSTLLVL